MQVSSALASLRNLTSSQLQNAQVIVAEFAAAGLPYGIGLAAIPNAMAESGLRNDAVGDNGNSVGLFQINALGGARTFDGDRRDPRYNSRWIAEEYKRYRTKKGRIGTFVAQESLDEAYARGASVAEMAGLFAAIVERPRDQVGEQARRAVLARSMFGPVADMPANLIGTTSGAGVWVGLGLVGAVSALGIYLVYRHRSRGRSL